MSRKASRRKVKRVVRVALIKVMPEKFEVERNWAALESVVRAHAVHKADAFVSPEGFLDGYCATEETCGRRRLRQVAEDLETGQHVRKARELAQEVGSYFVFCFTEKRGGRLLNAAALLDRSGEIVGVYHKTHLQGHDRKYDPGDALPVFGTDFGTVGLMVCADRRWPETVRSLRLRGAELILNPTYGMHHDLNRALMRTRSYENGVFICFAHPSQALITAPDGSVVAELVSNVPDVLVHTVDLSHCNTGHQDHRRPDLYKDLLRPPSRRRK